MLKDKVDVKVAAMCFLRLLCVRDGKGSVWMCVQLTALTSDMWRWDLDSGLRGFKLDLSGL